MARACSSSFCIRFGIHVELQYNITYFRTLNTRYGDTMEIENAMSTRQAARELNVSVRWICMLCANGKLDCMRAHGRWWIEPSSVRAYARTQGKEQR